MNRIQLNRRGYLVALTGGIAVIWLGSRREPRYAPVEYQVPEVGIPQAKALIDAGAIVIDVRDQIKFNYRHIPAAILVPLVLLRAGIPSSLTQAKDRPVVIYCNSGLSHGPEATHLLQVAGFKQVVNLTSGIEGWDAAGMPVIRGKS